MISVDGTFLKGKFAGTLLLAAAMDGDNHILPLAFGLVDTESDATWRWFFENIKNAFGDRENLVVISDRKTSIPKGALEVFPYANYGVCIQHLWGNLLTKFRRRKLRPLFLKAAKAYTHDEYEYFFDKLSDKQSGIKDYLIEANPELWARSKFPGKRYQVMTTNISECMNAVLRENRSWPVAFLVLAFRKKLQQWFYRRMSSFESMKSRLTSWAYKLILEKEDEARSMKVCVSLCMFF